LPGTSPLATQYASRFTR